MSRQFGTPNLSCSVGRAGSIRCAISGRSELRSDVQPNLWIDEDFLSSRNALHDQILVGGDTALDQAEGDRTQLEVPRGPADEADLASLSQQRCACPGQGFSSAVEVQPNQAAGRATQGMNPGHGLLSAIAALVEMDRNIQHADFIRNRALVGVHTDAWHARRDPARLVRPGPGLRSRGQITVEVSARYEDLMATERILTGAGQQLCALLGSDRPHHRDIAGLV